MKSCAFVLVLGALSSAELVLQSRPGQTGTLGCGLPDSGSSVKWFKGSELLHSINPRTGMPLKGKGDLVKRSRLKNGDLQISNIAPGDAGVFTCSVSGEQENHRLVVSSVSVRPSGRLEAGSRATLVCDVKGLPQDAVVEWAGPGPRGRGQHKPTLELPSVTLEDAGLWDCVFIAGGTTMRETVTLQVTEPRPRTTAASTTRTTEGDVKKDLNDIITGPPPAAPERGLGLSWWVWPAVGGGALVLLLWGLILVLFTHMTRRKRRFMKMRNATEMRTKLYCQCPGRPRAAGGRRGKRPRAQKAILHEQNV